MIAGLVASFVFQLSTGSIVVIDPGHGGYQPGARAGAGMFEKHLTLKVASALKEELERRGHTVLLSRTDDRYVSLGARSRFANAQHADVMVSIHANDSRNKAANGIETYFLSREASDAEAQALADKENNDPQDDTSAKELLESILSDLRKNNAEIESEVLAGRIQSAVVKATGARSRGVKQAPLAVLKHTEMAAVLVEIGFLTNPGELDRLWSSDYQTDLAGGIATGIDHFLHDTEGGKVAEVPPPSDAPFVSLDRRPIAKRAPRKVIVAAASTKCPSKVAKVPRHTSKKVAVTRKQRRKAAAHAAR